MGCAMGTVRYILFFFNFLLALAGLAIVILGIVTARTDTYDSIQKGDLTTPAIVFAIVGGCIFLFAFFGCCGAIRESHCMIVTYAVLLLTLFLLQVAVAVLAYTFRGKAEELIKTGITESYNKYKTDTSTERAIDNMQQALKCCGTENNQTPWGSSPPNSCYPDNNGGTDHNIFKNGCTNTLEDLVYGGLSLIGTIAIIVAVVQAIGIIFSLCLANSIRRSELRGYA